jgi:DNA-binding MarR family transcriptional regulator
MSTQPGLATRHEHADDSTGLLLWQVTNQWQSAQRAALKPFELTHMQFVLLASLAWLGGDGVVTQKQLSEHVASHPMMTSQVLRGLEQRGLVERAKHPDDGRARALKATKLGRALANKAVVAVEACDEEFFSALGTRQKSFTGALRTLRRD